MAKKTRTPAPPRRPPQRPVQAPKVRTGKDRTGAERRLPSPLMLGVAASGILAFVAVLAVILLSGGGSSGPPTAQDFLPAKFTQHPTSVAGQHVGSENAKVDHSTFPPTSGQHYGLTAVWGFYAEPVNKLRAVHNLEHGGVVVWYGPRVPEAELNELREFYNESPNAILVTPLPGLGRRVVLTAWFAPSSGAATRDGGKMLTMNSIDLDAMRLFRDEFRGKGPEPVPPDRNLPGGN